MKSLLGVLLLPILVLSAPSPSAYDKGIVAYDYAGKAVEADQNAASPLNATTIDDRFNFHLLTEGLSHGLHSIVQGFQETGAALFEGVFSSPDEHHHEIEHHELGALEHHHEAGLGGGGFGGGGLGGGGSGGAGFGGGFGR